jgi:hypothetical protein
MPSKRGRRAQEPAPPRPSAMSYAEWKAKVAAELSGPATTYVVIKLSSPRHIRDP